MTQPTVVPEEVIIQSGETSNLSVTGKASSAIPDLPSVRAAFPAFRVYVYGVNITPDTEGVSIVWNVGGAPNSAVITIHSPDNKYLLTMNDILEISGRGRVVMRDYYDSLLPQLPRAAPQVPKGLTASSVKGQILRPKAKSPKISVPVVALDGTQTGTVLAPKYEFIQGRPIFHATDPIRVWFRDPFYPQRWFWMFSGQVTDAGFTENEDHEQIITLTCEDVTRLFKWARVNTNPNILEAASVGEEDVVVRMYTSALAGYSLPEAVIASVFGTSSDDLDGTTTSYSMTDREGQQHSRKMPMSGVGAFDKDASRIFFFGGDETGPGQIFGVSFESGAKLSSWQGLVDNEVQKDDLLDMLWTQGRVFNTVDRERAQALYDNENTSILDVIDFIGSQPAVYPIDGGALYMLLPDGFGPNFSAASDRDISAGSYTTTEYTNRLKIINDAVTRFGFFFYASPRGDLLVEMPLYDFDPDDFLVAPGAESTYAGQRWLQQYVVRPQDTYFDDGTASDAKIRTQFSCTPYPIKDLRIKLKWAPVVVTLHSLVPLYGRRLEQGDPYGFIDTAEGARLFAAIQLRKINADAFSMHLQLDPRFGCGPNRPVHVKKRNVIGLTLQTKHSVQWGAQECSSSIDLSFIRGWSGEIDANGRLIFPSIGGKASSPLDYKAMAGAFSRDLRRAEQTDQSPGGTAIG